MVVRNSEGLCKKKLQKFFFKVEIFSIEIWIKCLTFFLFSDQRVHLLQRLMVTTTQSAFLGPNITFYLKLEKHIAILPILKFI